MRICVIGLRGMPGVAGGVETHCELLLPRLRIRLPGAAITVLGRSPYMAEPERLYDGVRIIRIWTIKQKHLEAFVHSAIGVLYAAFRLRADTLHIHAIGPGLMTPLARLLGMRVIVTHHGADYRRAKWGALGRAALRLGELLSTLCAHRIIVVSRSTAQALCERFPRAAHKILYVPNGAPAPTPAQGDDAVLDRFALLRGGFVLAVGRLVPEKGFGDLIRARIIAQDARPLVIAGDADHADAFSRALRRDAGAGVIFTGRLNRSDLFALYRGCALFVLPSHHEGLALAALEALAAGAAVLVSDIDANRDLGLPERCYFPVADVTALAAKLKQPPAMFDPGRAALARFDWERTADETAALYRALADQAL